jgi:RNA-directed DNA polymerase
MRARLQSIKSDLHRKMHETLNAQGRWLRTVVVGYFNYHAVPTNSASLAAFMWHVFRLWYRALRRRSQKDRTTPEKLAKVASKWLPFPRILHPWPNQRFAVKHPRWEPSAGIPLARICAGGAR